MSENPPISEGQLTTPQNSAGNGHIPVEIDVKVKILHTIAKAIYATPVGKIREAVANSMDNEATWLLIMADRTTNTLCIYDNGKGISEDRFHEIFKSIGYGLLTDEPDRKLSYFGLGLMSIFQLGNNIKIFTRPKGEGKIVVLKVNAKEIFDPDNQNRSIKDLTGYIQFGSPEERKTSIAPQLDGFIEKRFGGIPTNFTEIVIEDVKEEDLAEICEPIFIKELEKVLPLRFNPDEPFLKRFTGEKGEKIKKLLTSSEFCPTLDVFFGIRGESSELEYHLGELRTEEEMPQQEIIQLWKYFPNFRSDLTFPDPYVYLHVSEGFACYIVHTIAKDFYREIPEVRETGFWVRNQNFLVKGADFLERPGPGRKIIDQPLRNWIFAEIFHKNMNSILTVSRTEYLFEDKKFIDFRNEVFNIVRDLNRILREIWERKRKVVEGLIDPFKNIADPLGPLQSTEQRLRRMVNPQNGEKFYQEMFECLNKKRAPEIEGDEARIDLLLQRKEELVILSQDAQLLVYIDPETKDEPYYQVSWDSDREMVKVSISPDLFNPKEVVFLGKSFTVLFVAKEGEDPGVSVDVDKKVIYINPFNKELLEYSVSILDVLIALEIADAISNDQQELKKNFLTLIGAKPAIAGKYVTPLGDELRRTLLFSSPGA